MSPQLIFKHLVWWHQKNKLGAIDKRSDISIFADIRGDRKCIYLGSDITICKHATLEVDYSDSDRSKIFIGDRTLISSFVILRTYGGTIKIGHSCFVNSFTTMYGHGDLTIGNSVLIGPQVTIIPANYGFKERNVPFRLQPPSMRGIAIGDNVWIGAGATILDGCTIGEGSIIGAGGVVTKNVEPYSIVAGVPAQKIGSRE